MLNIRQTAIGLALTVVLAGVASSAGADTNEVVKAAKDGYDVKDMFQTVVTPTEWSTSQAEHDKLPDVNTMPKLDKEAIYLYYKELETEKHIMTQKMIKYSDGHHLTPTWGQYTYGKYDDGLLEFDIFARRSNTDKQKERIHFFQKQDGKFYEQKTPPAGVRTLIKKWVINPAGGKGTIEDYKNNMKWSGSLQGNTYNQKNALEYTETFDKDNRYQYKAEFIKTKTPYGEEIKFKTTHIATKDGKSSKPVVTETVYKGSLLALMHDLGLWKGYPPPMKTFKTIRD